MELECVKYKEKMDSAEAHCRHPGDYCKDRGSCLIHFMGKNNEKEGKDTRAGREAEDVLPDKHGAGNDRA